MRHVLALAALFALPCLAHADILDNFTISGAGLGAVPEPAPLALLATGLLALPIALRRFA